MKSISFAVQCELHTRVCVSLTQFHLFIANATSSRSALRVLSALTRPAAFGARAALDAANEASRKSFWPSRLSRDRTSRCSCRSSYMTSDALFSTRMRTHELGFPNKQLHRGIAFNAGAGGADAMEHERVWSCERHSSVTGGRPTTQRKLDLACAALLLLLLTLIYY